MLEYSVLFRHRERRKHKALLPPPVYSLGILIDQPAYQNTAQPLLPFWSWRNYRPRAARQLEQEHTMSYVTIAERHGLAKGLAKGRIEGWAGGRIEGQAELLLGLIQRRFGPVPDDVTQRIQTAQTAQLQAWSLNVLDAVTLEDVFQD